jgi:hypothetical protein
LTGAGTAPELMAEAVFALDRVARLHNLDLRETHATFGGVAFARAAQMVPPATRATVLGADAVLVAGAEEPTLDEVMGDLDLRAQATRVRFGHLDDVVVVSPRFEDASEWAVEKAFALAERRTMRLAAVGDAEWRELVVAVAPAWAEAFGEIVAASASARVAAHGVLAEHGPSLFVPAPDGGWRLGGQAAESGQRLGGHALAGSGVVNPSSMLLAAAMMLDFGLGEHAAAATLAGAVSATLVDGPQTPDLLRRGMGATTREFTSRVVSAFQLTQPWGSAA